MAMSFDGGDRCRLKSPPTDAVAGHWSVLSGYHVPAHVSRRGNGCRGARFGVRRRRGRTRRQGQCRQFCNQRVAGTHGIDERPWLPLCGSRNRDRGRRQRPADLLLRPRQSAAPVWRPRCAGGRRTRLGCGPERRVVARINVAELRIVGTWDGDTRRFTLTETPTAPDPSTSEETPAFEVPCPEPDGGWPRRPEQPGQDDAVEWLQGRTDISATWLAAPEGAPLSTFWSCASPTGEVCRRSNEASEEGTPDRCASSRGVAQSPNCSPC